jgi:hypothetical protein
MGCSIHRSRYDEIDGVTNSVRSPGWLLRRSYGLLSRYVITVGDYNDEAHNGPVLLSTPPAPAPARPGRLPVPVRRTSTRFLTDGPYTRQRLHLGTPSFVKSAPIVYALLWSGIRPRPGRLRDYRNR